MRDHRDVTLDRDFLQLPFMAGLITDQHLIERDRLGRTLTFMARLGADGWTAASRAIAIDRETAVLVDAAGHASIVANADHPTPCKTAWSAPRSQAAQSTDRRITPCARGYGD